MWFAFGTALGNIWAIFIPISSHTGLERESKRLIRCELDMEQIQKKILTAQQIKKANYSNTLCLTDCEARWCNDSSSFAFNALHRKCLDYWQVTVNVGASVTRFIL